MPLFSRNGRRLGLYYFVLFGLQVFIYMTSLVEDTREQCLSSWLLEFTGEDGIEELLCNVHVPRYHGEIKIQYTLRKIQIIIIRIIGWIVI